MPVEFKAYFKWSDDINTRQESLNSFATSANAKLQFGSAAWGDGLYLLLHFDLITITPSGKDESRSDVYDAISDVVRSNSGTRLGGSVYIVPLLPHKTSEQCAVLFWNLLRESLAGMLKMGDSFFVHYAPDIRNLMGGIAEVVDADGGTLIEATVTA